MKHTNIYNYLNTSNIINYKRILCFILNNPYGITNIKSASCRLVACGFFVLTVINSSFVSGVGCW